MRLATATFLGSVQARLYRTAVLQGSNAQGREPGEQLETCLSVGRILFVGRRYRECLALIEPAITSHPSNVPLLHLRGLCLQAMNNQPAVGVGRRCIVTSPAGCTSPLAGPRQQPA